MKEQRRRVYKCDTNAYQSQLSAGFSTVCEIFKVHAIESIKYVREFHTPVIVVTFPRPQT